MNGKPYHVSRWPLFVLIVASLLTLPALLLGSLRVNAEGTKRMSSQQSELPFISGCSNVEGYVVDEDRTFKVTTARCNGFYEAWLSKRKSASPSDNVPYRDVVIDHLRVRELRLGEKFSSGPYCVVSGKEVLWLAIYDWGRLKRITGRNGRVRDAWIANLATGKFEHAPEKLVRSATCTANQDE